MTEMRSTVTEATETFRLTFDYLCPFARIANETVVEALQTGVDWDVTFHAFSLAQAHVVEGDPDVWEREQGAEGTSGVRALEWALAVRDGYADQFFDFHVTLFSARHDHAKDVNDEAVLREAVTKAGLDPDVIAAEVGSGRPLARLAEEHREAVDRWAVFGVP